MAINAGLVFGFTNILERYRQSFEQVKINNEIDFINRTVDELNNIQIISENQSIVIRSRRIHATPKIRYYPQGPLFRNNYCQIELGDMLFIYKYFVNAILRQKRGIIVQAKFTNNYNRIWEIDRNQFQFLIHWPVFDIGSHFNRRYKIIPTALTWAVYSFIGQNATRNPIYYSSKRMAHHLGHIPQANRFAFHVLQNFSWDCSRSFFMRFIRGLVGENLLLNIDALNLVNDLYIMVRLEPDPPGAPDWTEVNLSDKESFGIIELTISGEPNERPDEMTRWFERKFG